MSTNDIEAPEHVWVDVMWPDGGPDTPFIGSAFCRKPDRHVGGLVLYTRVYSPITQVDMTKNKELE